MLIANGKSRFEKNCRGKVRYWSIYRKILQTGKTDGDDPEKFVIELSQFSS